jgi:hypothetical protein
VGVYHQFSAQDYLLALPMTLLTLFALGTLLMDLMLTREQKWVNSIIAFIGLLFSGPAWPA